MCETLPVEAATDPADEWHLASMENPNTPLDPWMDEAGSEDSGLVVSEGTAKTFAPWWQAINVISGDVAQLPLVTYRRLEVGKERATGHPTYNVLHRRPNDDIGPFQFKQILTMQCLAHGNAYAWIKRKAADIVALVPLDVGSTTPVRENGKLHYVHQNATGHREVVQAADMFHLRGPSDDGMQGKSVVTLAKESLAVGMQAQRYGNRFFRNDARPGLVLEFPEAMDGPAVKNILKFWNSRHAGAHNASKPALLDRGGKVSAFSMSNNDAQFLETRQFSRSEIASWFNLPPHKVGDLTHATFSNIEQQSIDYVVYSLMPWLIRWQDECNAKLFRTAEIKNDTYFTEFLVSALLRGDYNSRMDGHTKALRMGLLSIDEIRSLENMNPIPDDLGGTHYVTMDLAAVGPEVPVEDEPEPPAEVEPDDEPADDAREILGKFVLRELTRAYERIGKQATRYAASPGRLQAWRDGQLEKEIKATEQALDGISEQIDAEYLAATIRGEFRHAVDAELDSEIEDETLSARVRGVTKAMSSDRPGELLNDIMEG